MSDEYIKKEIVCMKELNIFVNDITKECRRQHCGSDPEVYSNCSYLCLNFAFKEMKPLLKVCIKK
mgnify:CR=1 FL=1